MLRSTGAIVAGFVVTVVLAVMADAVIRATAPGEFSESGFARGTWVLAVVLAYQAVFATVGGYVAARLAPLRPLRHAIVLGVISLAITLAATVAVWSEGPAWYHGAANLLVLPAAFAGGLLYERQQAR